jgi:hypothetical protein
MIHSKLTSQLILISTRKSEEEFFYIFWCSIFLSQGVFFYEHVSIWFSNRHTIGWIFLQKTIDEIASYIADMWWI